jgi:hypothetical protein
MHLNQPGLPFEEAAKCFHEKEADRLENITQIDLPHRKCHSPSSCVQQRPGEGSQFHQVMRMHGAEATAQKLPTLLTAQLLMKLTELHQASLQCLQQQDVVQDALQFIFAICKSFLKVQSTQAPDSLTGMSASGG